MVMKIKVLIGIVSILDKLDEWAEDTPLRLDAQRFGNLAFRDWGRRVEEVHPSTLKEK